MAGTAPTVRAFVAVELPDDVRSALRRQMTGLRDRLSGVSWTRPANLHLTLRFFGEVSEETVPELQGRLERELRDASAFSLEIAGLGAFPNLRRPSVIWAGVPDPDERLFGVQRGTESAAVAIGCEPDMRPFTPHVTFGRVRRPRPGPWADVLRERQEWSAGGFTVSAVSLFSSTLTPSGARHTRIADIALGTS